MKSMHLLLNEAEHNWREELRDDFPLHSNTSVVKNTKPNGRDWTFSTDLKKIFAHISNDESLQKKFKTIIGKYWDGNPEDMARETLHYLLFHELYHSLEAPFSVVGDDNDNKKIHQSIRRGVIQAEPNLSPLEQVMKVQASQNGVKDFILDNRFALDNEQKGYVRRDIISTWDVLELQDSPSKTNFYTTTRLLYGLLYGPKSTHVFFEEKAGKDGHQVAEKTLSELLGKSVQLPNRKSSLVDSLVDKAKRFAGLFPKDEGHKDLTEYVRGIREVFAGSDRYKGIERFMKVLGPYVEKDMPQGRPDMQGEGAGASPQNILQDLLDDMNPAEQQQFIQQLVMEKPNTLEQAASQMQPSSGKPSENSPATDQMKNLDLLATHEFYKRNHPQVHIKGGRKVGESLVVGKRENWHLKKSDVLTQDQLGKVNLRRIDLLQQRTRLPWLIDLGNGMFRLNEYELQEKNIRDIVYKDARLDVPDVVEFYVDSSGSMFSSTLEAVFKVNDGSSWDMLSHVLYGLTDALYQGGKQVGKQSKLRIHNFANNQVSSQIAPVDKFWEGDAETLRVLFKPENGYDYENIDISSYKDGQKRAYVVVTDGDLVLDERTEREAKKMKNLARDSNNTVVLFEIGGTYSLGNAVKKDKNVLYYPVHNKEEMLKAGLEVLLSK